MSFTESIRTYLAKYLDSLQAPSTHELEDLGDFHLASATMEQVRKGQEKVYSLDDVERGLHR